MPTLDTNVLLRYLVKDDPQQSREASKFISQFSDSDSALFLPTSVALEMEWVLRSAYQFSKETVIELFVGLLEVREISFQDEASMERAIFLYRKHNVDFADCLHVATAYTHDQLPLVTFDKKATRVDGIEVVST